MMSNIVKSFDFLVISLNILHNYFNPNKIIFRSVFIQIFGRIQIRKVILLEP